MKFLFKNITSAPMTAGTCKGYRNAQFSLTTFSLRAAYTKQPFSFLESRAKSQLQNRETPYISCNMNAVYFRL
jgi:hypothetical protein